MFCVGIGRWVIYLRLFWSKETVPTVGGGAMRPPPGALPERLLPRRRSAGMGRTGFQCDALGTHFGTERSSRVRVWPGGVHVAKVALVGPGVISFHADLSTRNGSLLGSISV